MKSSLEGLIQAIKAYSGPPMQLMEVCGTHTRQLSQFGIPGLLPPSITLISGPGCPVCVTPAGYIDRAAALSRQPGSTLVSFGDMLRVPGTQGSLLQAKAEGGSVALMYSPMDALALARQQPHHTFYVAAVGFETTLPLYALLIRRMEAQGIANIRLLMAVKALLPGLEWLCQCQPMVKGFIGPGHVSAILGWGAYEALCKQYRIPMTVAGFGYEHLITGIYDLMQQVIAQKYEVHNLYPSAVTQGGNSQAQALIADTFRRGPSVWRGLGPIAEGGYHLAPAYAHLEAPGFDDDTTEPPGCLCGQVIIGRAMPVDCPRFGTGCTPENPVGPCMVSSEGACGIWHATARTR